MGRPHLRALAIAATVIGGSGCYNPSPVDGLPCGPGGACPAGQACDLPTDRCLRDPVPSTDGPEGDAPLDASLDAALDASIDAAAGVFLDPFSRADDAALGNGWIEKNPPVYSLAGGEVVRIATPTQSYRDNMCYRPASEDLLDVEVSVQVRFVQSPPRYAQIFVRGASATIAAPDSYDGYLLYVVGDLSDTMVLGRQRGTVFVITLSMFTLSPPLNTTDLFRFVLRAQGTMPVQLMARVERRVLGIWTTIGETAIDDAAAERIATAGTVGFAGDEIAAYVYDDFQRISL